MLAGFSPLFRRRRYRRFRRHNFLDLFKKFPYFPFYLRIGLQQVPWINVGSGLRERPFALNFRISIDVRDAGLHAFDLFHVQDGINSHLLKFQDCVHAIPQSGDDRVMVAFHSRPYFFGKYIPFGSQAIDGYPSRRPKRIQFLREKLDGFVNSRISRFDQYRFGGLDRVIGD